MTPAPERLFTRLIRPILQVGTPPNGLLRAGLAVAAAVSTLATAWTLVRTYPLAVDLEIPLRAVDRWLHGAAPYLLSSFDVRSGPDQPFLYPPFLLLVLAPAAALPRVVVVVVWGLVSVVAAAWTCRRLGIGARWWPLVLAWTPFAQALLGLNVQVVLFAAFVALFWETPERAGTLRDRDPAGSELARSELARSELARSDPTGSRRPAVVDGLLAVGIAALKTSQVEPWVYLLRRRPRAALLGVASMALLVAATLPLTGLGQWAEWIAQVRRAAEPGAIGGISPLGLVPLPIGTLVTATAVVLVFAVPRRRAGAWIGLLTLIASPNLHYFGLLFALPAMLAVRREIGLAAALSISLYTVPGAWFGVGLVTVVLLLSERLPWLLEPVG